MGILYALSKRLTVYVWYRTIASKSGSELIMLKDFFNHSLLQDFSPISRTLTHRCHFYQYQLKLSNISVWSSYLYRKPFRLQITAWCFSTNPPWSLWAVLCGDRVHLSFRQLWLGSQCCDVAAGLLFLLSWKTWANICLCYSERCWGGGGGGGGGGV